MNGKNTNIIINSTGKMKLPFHALNDWYKNAFKMYGWMVLSASGTNKGMQDYVKDITSLIKAIDDNINDFTTDKKRDLQVMKDNLQVLLYHINNTFGNKQTGVLVGGKKVVSKARSKNRSSSKSRK